MEPWTEEIRLVYADISASFLALCAALEANGVLSNAQIREAAQERLLTLTAGRGTAAAQPFVLLQAMAVSLPSRPEDVPPRPRR